MYQKSKRVKTHSAWPKLALFDTTPQTSDSCIVSSLDWEKFQSHTQLIQRSVTEITSHYRGAFMFKADCR